MYDVIIIGAGTAGLSASIYARRAGKRVLVLEKLFCGGQIINTPKVENYPGILNISGYEFAENLRRQAMELGAEILMERVLSVSLSGKVKEVTTAENSYQAGAVIIATGAKNKKLGIRNEERFAGAGVSYCATCDGMFFKGKDVAVVGGGNTALEDALFLSDYCRKVYLIHRRENFRGEIKLQDSLRQRKNVEFVLNVNVVDLCGDKTLEEVVVRDKNTKEERRLEVSGIFIAIGQEPENEVFKGNIDLDEIGYIRAGEDCVTSVQGVFAAGDCRTKTVRQLATAAADGAVAALAACGYLAID